MNRIVMFVAIGMMCAPLAAQDAPVDVPGEITRIADLKKAAQQAFDQSKLDEAAKGLQEAVAAQTKLLGADHPETLVTMGLLAETCSKQERREDTYKLREAILDAQRRVDGKATDDVVWSTAWAGLLWGNELFGGVADDPKDLAGARELVRRLRERSQPFADRLTADTALDMAAHWIEAWTECRSGNPQQAIRALEPGLVAFQDNAWGHMAMALFCSQVGDKELAHDWYLSACAATAGQVGRDEELEKMKKGVESILFGDQPPPAEIDSEQCFAAFDRLLTAYPQVIALNSHRGHYAARICRIDQALTDLRKVLERWPENAWSWYNLAIASLYAGQVEEYQKTLQGMHDRFAKSAEPFDRHLLIIVWSLAPNPEIDGSEILDLANRSDRTDDSRVSRVLYRCGKLDEAMAELAKKPDGILSAIIEWSRGNKTAAQRHLADARHWVQSHHAPVTNYFVGDGTVMEAMESEIMWNEAVKMIGSTRVEPFLDKLAQLLVGDWTATATITGGDDSGTLKPGDKCSMVASFQLSAGGQAIVGTQKLTVIDRPNVSVDASVLIAWDPVDMAVGIFACWSDGTIEYGSLKSVADDGFRGDYVLRMPNGQQAVAEIALERESHDKFAWVFQSGPDAGKPLSCWQRK